MKLTLRTARLLAGLTLTEAAKKLNVTRNTLYKWETKKTYPTIKDAYNLCDLYDVELGEIIWV